MSVRVIEGDCLETLDTVAPASVQCCVTSPPYYGLRSYDGGEAEIGLEDTPDAYVARLVEVFREVRKALRDDGVMFLNLGDSYGAGKQLHGIPWRVAFALQADGWWLRSAIVWAKPNPMPESVRDRPTSSYEMVFLLSKSASYLYDAEAIAEPAIAEGRIPGGNRKVDSSRNDAGRDMSIPVGATRNCRNVWEIATQPYSGAHFATMPPDLAERCIKAGSRPGDTVLDPFGGAGTTGLVADRLNRNAILCELNPTYAALARGRLTDDAPLFAVVA